jgi:hypothetical protein
MVSTFSVTGLPPARQKAISPSAIRAVRPQSRPRAPINCGLGQWPLSCTSAEEAPATQPLLSNSPVCQRIESHGLQRARDGIRGLRARVVWNLERNVDDEF